MRTGVTSVAFVLSLLALCTTAHAKDSALDAPPPNLVPATLHLSAILAAHDVAVGRPAGRDTVIEDWRFTDSGMSGTVHLERSGTDYHSRITTGPFVEEYGQRNGKRWHRDYNGYVSPTTSTEDVTFFAERVNEDAADPKNDANVVGMTQGEDPAYVVKVQSAGGDHPEWIFYDAHSGLITRVEWVTESDHRIVSLYDDYRRVGGLMTAWHVHDDWDPRQLDDDYVRTSMQAGVPVDLAQFAMPKNTERSAGSGIGFTIPSQMYDDGTIIVRMTVNGRGLDMLLDTAASRDIIDEDVARQMGLPTFGHVAQIPNGDYVPFETLVPSATVGPLVLNSLVLYAEPFTFQWSSSTRVVGLLGYDFLAGHVVKIDYDTAKLTVEPTGVFDADNPVPGGVSYPLDFDDGMPFMSLAISDVTSDDVLLANEFMHTEFFGTFTAAHADAFVVAEGKHEQEDLPFANNDSFGRRIENWQTRPKDVHFGSVDFQQPLVHASNFPLYLTEDRPIDAALGFDFLKFFDVYLDYPHGRFIVAPNQLFFKVTRHA